MKFQYNDGGRKEAGFQGTTGDCVTRSIAIVTQKPYKEVYDLINELSKSEKIGKRKKKKSNARTGVFPQLVRKLMASLGYTWIPTIHIGSGCKVHLKDGELPTGRLLVNVSRHYTAIIDGIINDTHDPQRNTMIVENGVKRFAGRCVYGYYIDEKEY